MLILFLMLFIFLASPIKENPQKGQTVIAKFTDGLWYRALCKRTNHTQNRYQLEYIEYGEYNTTPLSIPHIAR